MLKVFNKSIVFFSLFISSFCVAQDAENDDQLTSICSPNECYTIEKELGRGVFGKVYAVRDSNGQQFALKSYIKREIVDPTFDILGDSKREFEIGQVLDHPNIIKSYDWFIGENETYYTVLEYVNGKTVQSTSRKSLQKEQTIHLLIQLIDALKYSFENEYIYLDLHAGNVMLMTQHEKTKIVDVSSFFSFQEIAHLFFKQKGLKKKGINDNGNSIREEKFKKFMAKNPLAFKNKKMARNINVDELLQHFNKYYFDRITEMAITFISKTDMTREEKIELFSTVKKISWNYLEESEDGIAQPMPYYLEQLVQTLESELK